MEAGTGDIGGNNASHSRRSAGLRIRAASLVGVRRTTRDAILGVWTMSIPTPIIPISAAPEVLSPSKSREREYSGRVVVVPCFGAGFEGVGGGDQVEVLRALDAVLQLRLILLPFTRNCMRNQTESYIATC